MRIDSFNEQDSEALQVLEGLLSSSLLDLEIEVKDCLSVFQEYEWRIADGASKERFEELLSRGDMMSIDEFLEFIELVSDKGQVHCVYWIVKGLSLLNAD